ncbi:putative mitochondrial protein [Apostasia shenzhenica]|uniref:Putative mitochondrial protein n=1 Tax=Apostasia shenzhenica TaxID=1088818 RepID=A0A2I0AJK5_9ASPA|nr:putative mitochondrial protein [Apostasia shenzhenica]
MLHCNAFSMTMNINVKLRLEDDTKMANRKYFRSLVGGLNYLSHSKPDIAYSVNVISKFMHNPSMQHLGIAKRILCYVAGIVGHGIWYSKVSNIKLFGYTDSD